MTGDFTITLYHNPDCGMSRNTLAMIRAGGYEPAVVEDLKTGWIRSGLDVLLEAMGLRPRDLLREEGAPAADLGPLDPGVDDEAIIQAMLVHPILVNRPVVATPLGV
jgi:arsenate reductase